MAILILSTVLLLTSAIVLYIHHLTHQEFLLHVAAIPLEILVGALLVDAYLARRERSQKMLQLSYIKGFLFRTEMKNIFVRNLRALENRELTLDSLRKSDRDKLIEIRANLGELTYRADADKDLIIDQYVRANGVFRYFMEWSIHNEADAVFHNMLFLLHFIQDVIVFRELYPGQSLMSEEGVKHDFAGRVEKVLHDNVTSFLDYAIELRRDRPQEFEHLMDDYLVAESRLRRNDENARIAAGTRL